jgi:nucleoside-diphosphate-sugar epimerase
MKLFLAGATGAIGRHAVPALVAAGHEVTAVARSDAKAAWLRERGAHPVSVSIFDRAQLADVVTGQDAVVNLATRIPAVADARRPEAWEENSRIRSEGSAALVDAALAAGVGRYVQESITFPYPDRGDAWIDEDTPLDVPASLGSTADAEASAARFTAAGGTGVVLRFAALYGPGSEQTEVLLRMARRHVGMALGPAGGYISLLHLSDAGSAVVTALSAPAGVYDVVDDEPVTKRAQAKAVGAAVGARPWVLVPGRFAGIAGIEPALTRSQRVSNAKLRALGWAPRYPSMREGVAATVAAIDAGTDGVVTSPPAGGTAGPRSGSGSPGSPASSSPGSQTSGSGSPGSATSGSATSGSATSGPPTSEPSPSGSPASGSSRG